MEGSPVERSSSFCWGPGWGASACNTHPRTSFRLGRMAGESGPRIAGYVMQRRHGGDGSFRAPFFKQRYMIAKGDFLFRYASDTPGAAIIGTPIPLLDVQLFRDPESDREATLRSWDGRAYDLQFMDSREREAWMKALFTASTDCITPTAGPHHHKERLMAQSPTTRQANYLARHMVELTRGPFLGVRDRDVGLYRGGPSSLRSPDSSMSPRGPSPYVGQVVPRVIAKTYMEEKRHKSGVRGANLYGGGKNYTPHR